MIVTSDEKRQLFEIRESFLNDRAYGIPQALDALEKVLGSPNHPAYAVWNQHIDALNEYLADGEVNSRAPEVSLAFIFFC